MALQMASRSCTPPPAATHRLPPLYAITIHFGTWEGERCRKHINTVCISLELSQTSPFDSFVSGSQRKVEFSNADHRILSPYQKKSRCSTNLCYLPSSVPLSWLVKIATHKVTLLALKAKCAACPRYVLNASSTWCAGLSFDNLLNSPRENPLGNASLQILA